MDETADRLVLTLQSLSTQGIVVIDGEKDGTFLWTKMVVLSVSV
jgi:hypothetical protein